jgi:hydrogenase expression/formation protein HypD
MKYLDEYRDPRVLRRYADALRERVRRPWRIMEVCGGQTHSIVRFGIDQLLPPEIELLHGPGCPVCVTPAAYIDRAIRLALDEGVLLCSFGDMLRVPGSELDLLAAKSRGADVRVVYSPLDALELAERNPSRQVVFFAVGFETTAPATALAILQARARGVQNFSVLSAHVLVPPAMEAMVSAADRVVDGFLAAGHVCSIVGTAASEALAARFKVPVVVTGFEPADLLQGILLCIEQLETGEARVDNQYSRAVRATGNSAAQHAVESVFEVVPRHWRGLGVLPASGLAVRSEYRDVDAELRFPLLEPVRGAGSAAPPAVASECIAGLVLQGRKKPVECPAFGGRCTPERPLGAPMVSSEGACAAYYRYRDVARSSPGEPAA